MGFASSSFFPVQSSVRVCNGITCCAAAAAKEISLHLSYFWGGNPCRCFSTGLMARFLCGQINPFRGGMFGVDVRLESENWGDPLHFIFYIDFVF